jgi:hypothetical protein
MWIHKHTDFGTKYMPILVVVKLHLMRGTFTFFTTTTTTTIFNTVDCQVRIRLMIIRTEKLWCKMK